MKIIVGLGNPGRQYEGTPHNVGFDVVDRLSSRLSGTWKASPREKAELSEVALRNEKLVLVKPLTYMNLSGQSVREVLRNRPVEVGDLLVVSDDVNLDLGRLKLRADGSHGGQNGLRSVIECLGTQGFARLRVGIRPPGAKIDDLSRFVLSRPRPEDGRRLAESADLAVEAAERWALEGVEAAANRFNGYPPPVRGV